MLAWDLPGHGYNRGVPDDAFTMAELATGVLRVVDEVLVQRLELGSELGHGAGGPFAYAGVSVGGAVGLQLLLDVPDRVAGAVLLCTGAKLGDSERWADRIDQVTAAGTSDLVSASAELWFAPGFLDARPEVGSALLKALAGTADAGYVLVCRALAAYDVRDRRSRRARICPFCQSPSHAQGVETLDGRDATGGESFRLPSVVNPSR
ncbi:hypothetical protein BH09ACT12_BH09ACT12_27220 [soil metagenome]